MSPATRHVCEIVDSWQALVDDELERDSRQQEKEGRLETVLRCALFDRERQARQTADHRLQYTTSSSSLSQFPKSHYHNLLCSLVGVMS